MSLRGGTTKQLSALALFPRAPLWRFSLALRSSGVCDPALSLPIRRFDIPLLQRPVLEGAREDWGRAPS
jgi:hypothetical protein